MSNILVKCGSMYLYSKYTTAKMTCCIGSMTGFVFGYFADCTVHSNAIVSLKGCWSKNYFAHFQPSHLIVHLL